MRSLAISAIALKVEKDILWKDNFLSFLHPSNLHHLVWDYYSFHLSIDSFSPLPLDFWILLELSKHSDFSSEAIELINILTCIQGV